MREELKYTNINFLAPRVLYKDLGVKLQIPEFMFPNVFQDGHGFTVVVS